MDNLKRDLSIDHLSHKYIKIVQHAIKKKVKIVQYENQARDMFRNFTAAQPTTMAALQK